MTSASDSELSRPLEETRHDAVVRRAEVAIEKIAAGLDVLHESPKQQVALSIIVPVYNERDTLLRVLARIDEVMPERTEIIVVDDASTDGTEDLVRRLACENIDGGNRKIIQRRRNHGKGSAVRLAIRHSQGAVVAIQDADSEYDPADLLRVIEPILQGNADVVYGSRYLEGHSDPSWVHRLGNWALTALSNCMTGQRLTDMETCHKAFRGDLVRSISLKECRFGFEPEITGKLSSIGITISEVPTGYQYRSYDEGKKITWKDGLAALRCMWQYRTRGWLLRAVLGSGRVAARLWRWTISRADRV